MTVEIYDFPREWYEYIVSQTFTLRHMNQSAARPWSGAGQAVTTRPHTQAWFTNVTMGGPLRDALLQDMDAFFTRLKGRAAVLRISNGLRLAPWYDRNLTANTSA